MSDMQCRNLRVENIQLNNFLIIFLIYVCIESCRQMYTLFRPAALIDYNDFFADIIFAHCLQLPAMHWRRCKASVTDLKRLITLITALSLGVMVGFSFRSLKSTHIPAQETGESQEVIASGVDSTSARPAAAAEIWNPAENDSYYIQVTHDIPLSSWLRKPEAEEGGEIECRIYPPRQRYFGGSGKFRHLPIAFAKYGAESRAMPACAVGSLIVPWATEHQSVWMVFVVKTAPRNFDRRMVIRKTWGSIEALRGKRFLVLFVVGRTGSEEEEEALKRENAAFGDLLQCDFEDNYRNLPVKEHKSHAIAQVLSAMRYMLEVHFESEFYTVTDDDCVMHMTNIVTFFDRAADRGVMYCGFLYDKNLKTIRNKRSKWRINVTTYDQTYYPTFCHGGMWTVTRLLMRDIYCMSEVTNRNNFHLEDVYITGILRAKLGQQNDNIQPALTRSGRKFELMYYPWDETTRVTLKMESRWRRWNRTLPWDHRQMDAYAPSVLTRTELWNDELITELQRKWSSINGERT